MSAKLYLIPNSITDTIDENFAASLRQQVDPLRVFFVEEIKSVRRLLRKINPQFPIDDCQFFDINEHTSSKETAENFKNAGEEDIGVISEAGCPCVADPGAEVVHLAHQTNREIIPLVGPSSILLALMASGMSGQNFAFNGYLPKDRSARIKKIKELEKRSSSEKQTQIFMEAPYRNQNFFDDLLQSCSPETLLCVAVDLTGSGQSIRTLSVKIWSTLREKTDLNKKPALFLIGPRRNFA